MPRTEIAIIMPSALESPKSADMVSKIGGHIVSSLDTGVASWSIPREIHVEIRGNVARSDDVDHFKEPPLKGLQLRHGVQLDGTYHERQRKCLREPAQP